MRYRYAKIEPFVGISNETVFDISSSDVCLIFGEISFQESLNMRDTKRRKRSEWSGERDVLLGFLNDF